MVERMRLIDADKLIKALKDYVEFTKEWCLKNDFTKGYCVGMRKARSFVYNQPTVEVVKYGHWEESPCLYDCFWICSCCRFPSQASAAPKLYKYCPNCGARMGVQNETN